MSKSSWYSKQNPDSVVERQSPGRVLRPVIARWMTRWTAPVENQANDDLVVDQEAQCRFNTAEEYLASIDSLHCKAERLESSRAEWISNLSNIDYRLGVNTIQRDRARERLSTVGESVPEPDQSQPSMLQESYLNIVVAMEMLQAKHDAATMKIEQLDTQQNSVNAEISQYKSELRVLELNLQNAEDNLRHAA